MAQGKGNHGVNSLMESIKFRVPMSQDIDDNKALANSVFPVIHRYQSSKAFPSRQE